MLILLCIINFFHRWHQQTQSNSWPRVIGRQQTSTLENNASTNTTTQSASVKSVRFLPRKSRQIRSVDTRQKEKQILDSVLGPKVYDRRIRPVGKFEPNMVNETGKKKKDIVGQIFAFLCAIFNGFK